MFYLIGNKGSFLTDLAFDIKGVEKKVKTISFDDLMVSLDELSQLNSNDTLIFIGGETLDEKEMDFKNFEFPKDLFDRCAQVGAFFFYLSSLSVFGWVGSDIVTLSSERQPLDVYGKTKRKFDDYVVDSGYENYCALLPASIHADRGRSSVEKILNIVSVYPFLKFIRLPGCLSFIYRKKLLEMIKECVVNRSTGFFIASDHFELNELSSNVSIFVPRLPLSLFYYLQFIIGGRKALALRMIFRGIYYK